MTVGESPLSNVGPGPDAFSLSALDADFVVLVLHRDFYCSEDRQQVRLLKRRYEEFETRDVEVVSVLPESEAAATRWQKQYHVPFPVVADPDARLGEAHGQSRRFGLLGRLHDVVGRMPATVVLDVRGDRPVEVFAHHGRSRTDRPAVDDVLEAVDRAAAENAPASDAGTAADDVDVGGTTGDGTTDDDAIDGTAGDDAVDGTADDDAVDGTADDDAAGDDDVTAATAAGDGETTAAGGDEHDEADTAIDPTDRPLRVPTTLDLSPDVWLRRATPADDVPVLRILQGALLEVGADRVREAIAASEVVVAEDDGFVVGALVLDGTHVEAVAVRRDRRGQGVGRALVETAAGDVEGPLTADFRAGVRGFWEELGFAVERRDGRLWGRRED